MSRARELLSSIYGEAPGIWPGTAGQMEQFRTTVRACPARPHPAFALITYGDQVRNPGERPLKTLQRFLKRHLPSGALVHILPFYPSTSDDGFSVADYFAVDPGLGSWDDIADLATEFDLMFDAVFNHASAQGDWFGRFLRQESGWETAFFSVPDGLDLSAVIRPRTHPLLTRFETAGGPKNVWTTFSADQVDLNFSDPRMFGRVLEALLFYVAQGARFIRLDAIGFLWKVPGTTCLHLPETHRIIQTWRAILDEVAPEIRLITETNVPHADNISYFGDGANEAHMVYNFALPPLVFHSIRTGDATALRTWASTLRLPSSQTTWFNFLASHDGIGLNPARGLLTPGEIDALVETVVRHGGFVSYKSNPDGSRSPYELNISYMDALSDPGASEPVELVSARFLAAHAILLAMQGLPAIYFHSLFGSRGDRQAAETSGIPRRINRAKSDDRLLTSELERPGTLRNTVFTGISELIAARRSRPSVSENAPQRFPDAPPEILLIQRGNDVLCATNVSDREVAFAPGDHWIAFHGRQPSGALRPYESVWMERS